MTDTDDPPVKQLLQAARQDFVDPSWQYRAATMLLTLGILTFGIMLGAHIMMADVLFGVWLPAPQARYQVLMESGMLASTMALVAAVALDTVYGGDTDD